MSGGDLKRLFKEAAEIAKSVPKELREAAFNRALDALSVPGSKQPAVTTPQTQTSGTGADATPQDTEAILLRDLDRTRHPEIASAPGVLERALYVLRAAREDHQIDGLSAAQIANLLTEKFRIRTTNQAVRGALDSARDKVDRNTSGRPVTYRIMNPGDQYLIAGDFGKVRRATSNRTRKATPKKTTKKGTKPKAAKKKRAKSRAVSKKAATAKKGSGAGRPGAGGMLRDLAASGFFSEPRSISEIQEHAQHNLAHTYGVNELSTPLRRAIHNGLLIRTRNADGQYSYSAA